MIIKRVILVTGLLLSLTSCGMYRETVKNRYPECVYNSAEEIASIQKECEGSVKDCYKKAVVWVCAERLYK